MTAADDARNRARRHLVPHFTKAGSWHDLPFPVIEEGEGAYVRDPDGRRYLDGLSGLFCTNLGHGRADLADAASAQMRKLAFMPSWGTAPTVTIEAAEAIAARAPAGLDHVFFVSSGSEAVESALKLARCYHLARGDEQRSKVIARSWSYHGTTLGALSVTAVPKIRAPFDPMLWTGVRHVPNTRGATVTDPTDAADLDCVRAVEQAILAEGPETISMVIAEPVQNGGGALVPPAGYWQALREICDRHGVLLCADEVICGFGRLGHWFGSERVGARPDLITFAKGVTSAYAPLGGVLAGPELVGAIDGSPLGGFLHGATFGGHPVAAAVAVATLRALDDEDVLANVRAHEGDLHDRLRRLADVFPTVAEVRGCGYFYALELVANSRRGQGLTEAQSDELMGGLLASWLWEEGLLIRPDDRGGTLLLIAPPLICGRTELDDLLERLGRVLDRVDSFLRAR